MGERIGLGRYQSCRSVGRVSVLGLRWCGWCRWAMCGWLGLGRVVWCYVCVIVSLDLLCRWQLQVSVYCARRISAHLRCTIVKSCCTISISAS